MPKQTHAQKKAAAQQRAAKEEIPLTKEDYKFYQDERDEYNQFREEHPELELPDPTENLAHFKWLYEEGLTNPETLWPEEDGGGTTPSTPATPEYSDEDIYAYNIYRNYRSSFAKRDERTAYDLDDYIKNREFYDAQLEEWKAREKAEDYTPEQLKQWDIYQQYEYKFRDMGEETAPNIKDFIANIDSYMEQLTRWQAEETRFSTEDEEEYNQYKRLASRYGEPSDIRADDIEEFFDNYDVFLDQLRDWQTLEQRDIEEEEYYQQRAEEQRQYALTPEEEARRREESYQRSQEYYSQQYQVSPDYAVAGTGWAAEGLEGKPLSYQEYFRSQFPRIQREFEYTLPSTLPSGYATRAEQEAEEQRRQQLYQGWLPEREKKLEEEWYWRSPTERGERPSVYAPIRRYIPGFG